MAKWQRTLNLLPEWNKAKDGEISIQELGSVVALRLSNLEPFGDDYLDDTKDNLVYNFDHVEDTEEFDGLMDELYDWADISMDSNSFNGRKVCWVKTF